VGPKSLLFTLQLPCPAGLATVAGNLVGSAMRVWLWFGRACGEAASLQGRACPSDWLWMTLCCAAVQPRDNSCRCKPRASHGSSLTHCIAGTTVASSGSGYGRHEPLPMLAARTGDQGTRAGCFLDSTFACKLVPCSPVRAASMGSGSCRPYPLADEARKWPCNARSSKSGNRSRVAQPGLTHKSDMKCAPQRSPTPGGTGCYGLSGGWQKCRMHWAVFSSPSSCACGGGLHRVRLKQ